MLKTASYKRHIHHLALAGDAIGALLAVPATAGDVAVAQRHHGAAAMQGGDGVADGNADAHRRTVRVAGDVADAAHRLADGAEARQVAQGAGLAVAGQAHHDGGRVELPEVFIAQLPLFQHAGTVVLDDDVGLQGELAGDFLGRSSFMLRVMLFLLRAWTDHHSEVPSLSTRHWRSGSPLPGASTLITSAPNSASMREQNGPAISVPSSSTLMPASGPGLDVPVLIVLAPDAWRRRRAGIR
jgi:hypothetical protein